MTKGSTIRHREKKKCSSTNHFTDTTSRDVSSSDGSTEENPRDRCLWTYCIFVILLSVGGVSLFCLKDTELFSRTLRSIKAGRVFSSTDQNDEELPCSFGDDFTVDRRSNLSLEEFIRCYDAKRY